MSENFATASITGRCKYDVFYGDAERVRQLAYSLSDDGLLAIYYYNNEQELTKAVEQRIQSLSNTAVAKFIEVKPLVRKPPTLSENIKLLLIHFMEEYKLLNDNTYELINNWNDNHFIEFLKLAEWDHTIAMQIQYFDYYSVEGVIVE